MVAQDAMSSGCLENTFFVQAISANPKSPFLSYFFACEVKVFLCTTFSALFYLHPFGSTAFLQMNNNTSNCTTVRLCVQVPFACQLNFPGMCSTSTFTIHSPLPNQVVYISNWRRSIASPWIGLQLPIGLPVPSLHFLHHHHSRPDFIADTVADFAITAKNKLCTHVCSPIPLFLHFAAGWQTWTSASTDNRRYFFGGLCSKFARTIKNHAVDWLAKYLCRKLSSDACFLSKSS